jgi:hypothetical protein
VEIFCTAVGRVGIRVSHFALLAILWFDLSGSPFCGSSFLTLVN